MNNFSKLKPYEKKDIVTGLIVDGLTYSEIEERYNVTPAELNEIIDEMAVKPYRAGYVRQVPNQDAIHRKVVGRWIGGGLIISGIFYFLIVALQSLLGGFESQIITDSIAYITQPFAKLVNLGLAISFILVGLYLFFPIIPVFINEKVNTISLRETFLKAKPESQLDFVAKIFLAFALLAGLVFNAKAENTNPRECIVKTAKYEIGVLETGGNNRGDRIDQYRSVALGKTVRDLSDPWCGYFVSYVFKTCKIPYQVNFSPRARDWFADPAKVVWRKNFQYGIVKRKPRPGDVVGYVFKAGNIGHVEILIEWGEDYFISVGGNTSNSNSVYRDANKADGVRLKRRAVSSAYIISNHIGA